MTGGQMALLGNMNNNHFALARYLRDWGFDARLLLFDCEARHFLPECDSYSTDYWRYTCQLSWGSRTQLVKTSGAAIAKELAPFERLIGVGYAPAYCWKAGRPLDIFVPYGDDLWQYLWPKVSRPPRVLDGLIAASLQRRGAKRVRVVDTAPTNAMYESIIARFCGQAIRWMSGVPMVYHPEYEPAPPERLAARSQHGPAFAEIRRRADFMVFSHARHLWTPGTDPPSNKRTDRLLRGWKLFLEAHPGARAALVTFDYGRDAIASKALIRELGIESSVHWFPTMMRKDLMVGLGMADLVVDDLNNSWIQSGVTYEALAAGKLVMCHREDELYSEQVPNLFPVLNANSTQAVALQLAAAWGDLARLRRLGASCREWYLQEVVDAARRNYLGFLRNGETVA